MTRLLLKHARNQRRVKYGNTLLHMFITKTKAALQSILRTAAGELDSQPLSTNLSGIREDITGRQIIDPVEVIAQVKKMEIQALSPDPTLPPGAPIPWLTLVTSPQVHNTPMISGRISPTILQEALRRTPNHKAAGPDGVPAMILKHMHPRFHEALKLCFQILSITGITPPPG
jgi:hypothetical protein